MYPDLAHLRERIPRSLDKLASSRILRIAIAAFAVCAHLIAFSVAGHDRLGIPFNSAPDERPYFSDPNAMAIHGYPRQPHHWSRLITARWDSQIYIMHAVRGLDPCPHTEPPEGREGDFLYMQCGMASLPAFGEIGGVISRATEIAPDFTLMFMAIICTLLINVLWTSTTIAKRLGRIESFGALIAFNFFPTAFYLVAPYTESITIVFALSGFVALCNERWFLASVLIGASSAFRMAAAGYGLGLCCAAALVTWRGFKARGKRTDEEKPKRWWWPMTAVPLSGWGMIVQMIALKIVVGTPFAYMRARKSFGDHPDYGRLDSATFYIKGFTAQHMDSVMLFGTVGICLLCGRELLKRFKPEEAIFLAVSSLFCLVISIAALHEYWGLNRYFLCCLPIFLCSGIMMRRYPVLFVLWLVLCALIYWHVELCSFISHGNAQVCPCLGRFEFGMPYQS